MNVADGVDQLLTPFPEYTYDDALAAEKLIRAKQPRERRGLPYVLCYLFRGGGETILVDPGWHTDEAYRALETEMRAHGSHPSEITRVLITHAHPDHYGMAGRLRDVAKCEIVMHERDAASMVTRGPQAEGWVAGQRAFMTRNGVPQVEEARPPSGESPEWFRARTQFKPDTTVTGGEVFRAGSLELEVTWTPGHTPGHICFYERSQRLMVTGDHVLPTITPNVSMFQDEKGQPLAEYVRSLELLRDYDVQYVLPAHEYSHPDLGARLDEIEAHHLARLEELRSCVAPGGSTAWEVASKARWARGKLTDFSPRLMHSAVGETVAHLEYLYEQGVLTKVERDGQVTWMHPGDAA